MPIARACRVVISRALVPHLLHLEDVEAVAFWMTDSGDLAIRLEGPGTPQCSTSDPLPLRLVVSKGQAPVVSWLVDPEDPTP